MSQQQVESTIENMKEIVQIHLWDVYDNLRPTAEQQEDENWWKNVFLQIAVNSDEYNFQDTWEVLRHTSQDEVFLIIEMKNQINEWSKNELGHNWDFGVLTESKIYNMYAYMHAMRKGVEHWKLQSSFWNHDMDNISDTESVESVEEEYTGTKDFPPNETDDKCPVCLEAYTSRKQRDGVRNSEYKVKCHHYCCCDCWLELYEKNEEGEKKRCPICRANVTDWLESVIPSYQSDYP